MGWNMLILSEHQSTTSVTQITLINERAERVGWIDWMKLPISGCFYLTHFSCFCKMYMRLFLCDGMEIISFICIFGAFEMSRREKVASKGNFKILLIL